MVGVVGVTGVVGEVRVLLGGVLADAPPNLLRPPRSPESFLPSTFLLDLNKKKNALTISSVDLTENQGCENNQILIVITSIAQVSLLQVFCHIPFCKGFEGKFIGTNMIGNSQFRSF